MKYRMINCNGDVYFFFLEILYYRKYVLIVKGVVVFILILVIKNFLFLIFIKLFLKVLLY